MSLRKTSRLGLAALVFGSLVLCLFWACVPTQEKGHTYFEIKRDTAWTKYDTLILSWKDPASTLGGDLFTGRPDAFGTSQKFLADGYLGQTIEITVKGVRANKTVHVEVLQYNGIESKVETTRQVMAEGTHLVYNPSPITLGEKDTANLPVVKVTPEILFDKSLQWSSSNPLVFVVEDGRIIAKGSGSATLTGQLVSNPAKIFAISVTVGVFTAPVVKVDFETETLILLVGGSAEIPEVIVTPDNADPRVEFSSSDETKARIENGRIVGVLPGDVSVIAQSRADADKKDTLTVTVMALPDTVKPIPAAPTINALSAGDAKATVAWTPVEGATSYNLYYAAGATVGSTGTKIAGAVSPREVTALINGTQYAFALSALSPGGESPLSPVVTATPKSGTPGAPTNVAAVGGDSLVTLTWSPVAGAASYNVYMRVGAIVGKQDHKYANVSSPFAATGLSPANGYAFAVTAVSALVESELSNIAIASPSLAPPGIPVMKSAAAAQGVFSIAWNAGTGAASHNLYYAQGSSVTLAGTRLSAVLSPKSVTGLTECVDYTFAATAVNAKGESALSANPLTTMLRPAQPSLTAASGNLDKCVSEKADFSVAATGTGTLSYQWRKDTVAIPGATSAAYSIPSVAAGNEGNYTCVIGNGCSNKVASPAAYLTVRTPLNSATIYDPPVASVGNSLTLRVTSTSTGPLTYQWRRDGKDISGGTTTVLNVWKVTLADNNAVFTCLVSNGCGTGVLSNPVTLKVTAPPE